MRDAGGGWRDVAASGIGTPPRRAGDCASYPNLFPPVMTMRTIVTIITPELLKNANGAEHDSRLFKVIQRGIYFSGVAYPARNGARHGTWQAGVWLGKARGDWRSPRRFARCERTQESGNSNRFQPIPTSRGWRADISAPTHVGGYGYKKARHCLVPQFQLIRTVLRYFKELVGGV